MRVTLIRELSGAFFNGAMIKWLNRGSVHPHDPLPRYSSFDATNRLARPITLSGQVAGGSAVTVRDAFFFANTLKVAVFKADCDRFR